MRLKATKNKYLYSVEKIDKFEIVGCKKFAILAKVV
jgi:hypothetical protein